MGFKNITILGGGVLGSQIAYQSAYCGFHVTLWGRNEGSVKRAQSRLDTIHENYIELIHTMDTPEGKNPLVWADGISDPDHFDKNECLTKAEEAYKSIKTETNLAESVKEADLVIESIAEVIDEKLALYTELASILPEKTVLVTNSSSFPCSIFAEATGRPEKYLSLHFANKIWKLNLAEVMRHSKTEDVYFQQIVDFAKEIRMAPVRINKEKAGYCGNSLLIPLVAAAMDLYINGVADPESIDTAWKVGVGAAYGPMEFLDIIGMVTPSNIFHGFAEHPEMVPTYDYKAIAEAFDKKIAEGKLGLESGEGFYKYNEK